MTKIDLGRDLFFAVGSTTFKHPIMIGAGWCKDPTHAALLAKCDATAAVMVGSVTEEFRTGNAGNVIYHDPNFTMNALGMPNKGSEYYRANIDSVLNGCKKYGKPLIINVAGNTPSEYALLAQAMLFGGSGKADLIELNLGCPNVWGDDNEQKPIPSFNPKLIEEILDQVKPISDRFLVKLSPYSDPGMLREVAQLISGYNCVAGVTTCNTLPNGMAFGEKGRPVISVGYGGISGPALRPVSLGQVSQFRKLLPDRIRIIGSGGISKGSHVHDSLKAGADMVQVTTAVFRESDRPDRALNALQRILIEYIEILEGSK